jgi:hypothetical protein
MFTISMTPNHSANIGLLRNTIKTTQTPVYDHVSPAAIKLWEVSFPINSNVMDSLNNLDLTTKADLMFEETLLSLFSNLREGYVHVVVDAPKKGKPLSRSPFTPCVIFFIYCSAESRRHFPWGGSGYSHRATHKYAYCFCFLQSLTNPTYLAYHKSVYKALSSLSPSKNASSNAYRKYQHNLPIYDGRYDAQHPTSTTAPPVQLFHPAFAHFLDDVANPGTVDIPDNVLQATVAFMRSTSAIYHKDDDRKEVLSHLSTALQFPIIRVINQDASSPGNIMLVPLCNNINEVAALLINEDKREIGEGGSDLSTQASLSMVRFWAQNDVCGFQVILQLLFTT